MEAVSQDKSRSLRVVSLSIILMYNKYDKTSKLTSITRTNVTPIKSIPSEKKKRVDRAHAYAETIVFYVAS